jgi:hypothetical protein
MLTTIVCHQAPPGVAVRVFVLFDDVIHTDACLLGQWPRRVAISETVPKQFWG